MATVVESIDLHFLGGSSDKVYKVQLVEDAGMYEVHFQYGRRGSTLKSGKKTASPVSYGGARAIYDDLVSEKTGKGYNVTGRGGSGKPVTTPPPAPTAPVKEKFGCLPQLLNPVPETRLEELLEDDDWVAQEKFDGERVMVRVTDKGVEAGNRDGYVRPLPTKLAVELESLETGTLLDGELIGDTFHVFEALSIGAMDLSTRGVSSRLAAMAALPFARLALVKRVTAASTEFEKRRLLARVKDADGEGVVFKRVTALPQPGRPASGGNWLKFKFVESATCLVAGVNDGKRSVRLELLEGATRVDVGNVTIPANHALPAAGELVEIQYLYAYKGGSLYQPVYKGPRTDLSLAAAVLSQLKYKPESAAV